VAQLSRGRVSVPAQAALSGSPKKASGFAGGPYFADGALEVGGDFRLAIVEEAACDGGESREAELCGRLGRGEGSSEERRIFKVAKEPAHGVKGFRKVQAAAPVAVAKRGPISGQAAERSGHADGATGVSTDGRDRGALKDAGDCAAGGAAGERAGLAGLKAVAEFGFSPVMP